MSNKKSLQEHLERMKYVAKYAINETPKYKSLVGDTGMDALPEYLMKEADATSGDTATPAADGPTPETLPVGGDAGAAPAPGGDVPLDLPAGGPIGGGGGGGAAPAPAAPAAPAAPTQDNTNDDVQVDVTTAGADTPLPAPSAPVAEDPAKIAMELQIDALRKMSAQIEDLGAVVDSLNARVAAQSNEIDKVREPSDMEKFENRKNDSSPYYFNLNDMWDGDSMRTRMDQYSKGYMKTEDGYVADFDDLPKLSQHEVAQSFNS